MHALNLAPPPLCDQTNVVPACYFKYSMPTSYFSPGGTRKLKRHAQREAQKASKLFKERERERGARVSTIDLFRTPIYRFSVNDRTHQPD